MPVRFSNRTGIKPIIRTVCEMCSKKQFYYQKNVCPVSLVKFEFLGYNDSTEIHNLTVCYCSQTVALWISVLP